MELVQAGDYKDFIKIKHKVIQKRGLESNIMYNSAKVQGNEIAIALEGEYKDKIIMFHPYGIREIGHTLLKENIYLLDPKAITAIINLADDEEVVDIVEFIKEQDDIKQKVIAKTNTITRPDKKIFYNLSNK